MPFDSGSQKVAIFQSGSTYYFHHDHLSPRFRTDSSGTRRDDRGTYPFGENWYSPAGAPWLYTSYYRDSESGNDYAMARSYINRLARFASPDALAGNISDPQSLNRYAYSLNDPENYTDPSGMGPCAQAKFPSNCGAGTSTGGGGGMCTEDGVPTPCSWITGNNSTYQYVVCDSRGCHTYQQDAGGSCPAFS